MKQFIDTYKEYLYFKKQIKNIFFMYDNEQQKYFVSIGWSPEYYKRFMFIELIK